MIGGRDTLLTCKTPFNTRKVMANTSVKWKENAAPCSELVSRRRHSWLRGRFPRCCQFSHSPGRAQVSLPRRPSAPQLQPGPRLLHTRLSPNTSFSSAPGRPWERAPPFLSSSSPTLPPAGEPSALPLLPLSWRGHARRCEGALAQAESLHFSLQSWQPVEVAGLPGPWHHAQEERR